jgi:hypothetical protein
LVGGRASADELPDIHLQRLKGYQVSALLVLLIIQTLPKQQASRDDLFNHGLGMSWFCKRSAKMAQKCAVTFFPAPFCAAKRQQDGVCKWVKVSL